MEKMFCYQCEQTMRHEACTEHGVCGKTATQSGLMDAIIEATLTLSKNAVQLRKKGDSMSKINDLTTRALFTTITNVNFDEKSLVAMYHEVSKVNQAMGEPCCQCEECTAQSIAEMGFLAEAKRVASEESSTLSGIRHMVVFGIKGITAYAEHAIRLGKENDLVFEYIHRALARIKEGGYTVNEMLALALECGSANIMQMETLHNGHVGHYNAMEPTQVLTTPVAGKCILVSGHDMHDLEQLLIQTKDKGINIYTHGEMLPAHAYPKLKQYKHLIGNYGTAWQNQQKEFLDFPGSILMTTNCIQKPLESYQKTIFTTGVVQFENVVHVQNGDFKLVIDAALACDGFKTTVMPEKKIWVGFNIEAISSVAPTVVDAVKSGAIKHFFLVGGCDGAKLGRNYYTQLVEQIPNDCVILTLACGKYRFNHLDLGDIGGIPRLLDVGQCNDAYGAIQIAVLLAGAFKCDVNALPLTFVLSWYEQKAVAVLLSLLSLGIKNIKLGPTLPAFLTPDALAVLIEKFNIAPISTPENDIKNALN